MPTSQPAPAVLKPVFSQPVQPPPQPGATMSPIQLVTEAQCFLFDDGHTLYGYSLNCLPLWTIAPRLRFNGWAVGGNDVFVQDGPVTLQYDLNALQGGSSPLPINAFNLSNKQGWTSQQANPPDLATIYTPPDPSDGDYSAPVVWLGNPNGPQVFVLTADGKVIPFGTNLTVDPSLVFATGLTPGPLALFGAAAAAGYSLHFFSGNDLVTMNAVPLGIRTHQPPAGGAALALALCAAISQGAYRSTMRLLPAGQTAAIDCSTSAVVPAWQLYWSGRSVALAVGLPAVMGGALQHRPVSTPVVFALFGAEFLVTLAADGAGAVAIEQYKLSHLAPGGSGRNCWPLVASQFAGIAPWLFGGAAGPVPFEPDSALACYAAADEALGFHHATYAEQLPPAVSRATPAIMAIAGPAPGSDAVARALADLCAVPTLLDSVADLGYDATRLASILHNGLGGSVPGRQVCQALRGRGFTENQVAGALHSAGYAALEVVHGLQPDSAADWKWWIPRAFESPSQVRPELAALGVILHNAGYLPADVAASLRGIADAGPLGNVERAAITAILFKSGYSSLSAEDVRQVLAGAGYIRREYRAATYWAYRDPASIFEIGK